MDNTVKYLQNNTQKLHYDLNESRRNEKVRILLPLYKPIVSAIILKESKDLLNKTILEKDEVQNYIEQLIEDKEKLKNEVNYLNGLCEKVLSGPYILI